MREVRIVIHMDADKPFEGRFCWPAQDRVRAVLPLTTPRTSPVFTASVFSSSEIRVSSSYSAPSPAVHRPSTRIASSTPGPLSRLRRQECYSWCCGVGSVGQPPLFPWVRSQAGHDEEFSRVVDRAGPTRGEGGDEPMTIDLRVMGEEDQPPSISPWY